MTLRDLLADLLSFESCPPLDRWFSDHSRRQKWSLNEQKVLWDQLRVAMVRAGRLPEMCHLGPEAGWLGTRAILQRNLAAWQNVTRLPKVPEGAVGGVPAWLHPSWQERIALSGWTDEVLDSLAQNMESPCPWHIRFSGTPEGSHARESLVRDGLVSMIGETTAVYRGPGQAVSPFLKSGAIHTQDAASQRTLETLAVRPGQRVWDVCAGHGGKTLLAAEQLGNKGALVATDISETKLHRLKQRVRGSGWQNIRILPWNGVELPIFPREVQLRGGFDRVFVDAPCSASGTWRRDPEARWRLTQTQLDELGRHQRRLIRLAWTALRPGGKLLYITCSWLPQENEHLAEEFSQAVGVLPEHQSLLGPPGLDSNWMYVAQWAKP